MAKTNRYTVIPERILSAIEDKGFTRIMRDKAVKFVSLLINKGMMNNYDLTQYVELPKNYLKKSFGSEYHTDFLNALKDMGIVEVNHEYKPMYGKGVSKSYRISQEFLDTSYVPTSYSDSSSSSESLLHICGRLFPKSIVFDDLKQLSIDREKLWKATQERINSVNVSHFRVDDEIQTNFFTAHIEGTTRELTRSEALHFVKQEGLSLIQDGSSYYIDDLDRYVETKKKNILNHYRFTLARLEKGIWFADRNGTNNRLDHNLTSMCSYILNIIKADNGIVEIDLCNSQFAILSYLMQQQGINTDDAKLFYKLSANGELYEFIQQALGYPPSVPNQKPKIGKQTMFELAFSSHRNTTANKKALKQMFPSVVEFVDGYKRSKKHHSEFAVWLQKTEAEIFIDGLYHELKQKGYWCITKHDSLLVRRQDHEAIKDYVGKTFAQMCFLCRLSGG